jgi:hypothetical protein
MQATAWILKGADAVLAVQNVWHASKILAMLVK